MKQKGSSVCKYILQPQILFYLAGMIVLVIYHINYDLSFGDAVDVYGNVLKRGSDYFPEDGTVFDGIFNFTKFHYLRWSSRNVIEVVLVIVSRIPVIVWHIADILIIILAGYCLDKTAGIRNEKIKYSFLFCFLMMYPIAMMSSAGWIATTTNYSWVVAFGLYVYLTVWRLRKGEKVSKISYILAMLAALYAMNQEQMCGFLFLFLGMLLVWDIRKKKLKKAVLPFFLLNIAELIWILTCPGNACRQNAETVTYFPEYGGYSFLHKFREGVSVLLKALFESQGIAVVTAACLLVLIYLAFKNRTSVVTKAAAIIPFCYIIVEAVMTTAGKGEKWFGEYRRNGEAVILGCVMLLCMCIAFLGVTQNMEERILLLGSLCFGAATKLVLGFSPAFYASGERTSIFLAFVLIPVFLFLIGKSEKSFRIFNTKPFIIGFVVLDVIFFLNQFASIHM
ncbi:MAG: hypothetical protein HFG80_00665 [Eubacterium sp.]|nr:hypothetical protein [Eubacterium sp.]